MRTPASWDHYGQGAHGRGVARVRPGSEKVEGQRGDDARARVLVVDDHPANLRAVEAILQPLALELVLVPSGEEALRQLLQGEFALILLDVDMPGLDGFDTAGLIKRAERTRHVPIIFLTAHESDARQVFRGYQQGAVDYLVKPFDPDALRAKVSVFVDLHVHGVRVREQAAALAVGARRIAEAEAVAEAREHALEVVAHELRNPLSVIRTTMDVLTRRLGDAEHVTVGRRTCEGLARSAERMARLVEDLLDVTRIEGGRLSVTKRVQPPGPIVEQALEQVRARAAARRQTLVGECEPSTPAVDCDADRISQVLTNLLENAIKFTPDGGTITLRARAEGRDVVFSVEDTGPGLAEAELPRIFDRYWQASAASREGLGLGLAICRGIVESHEGRIWAASRRGAGSTFSFALRGCADRAAEAPRVERATSHPVPVK